jgi:phage tail-like protein
MSNALPTRDPIPAFRFELRINDILVGGFSECSGLQLETEFKEYNEGGLNSFVRKFPTRTKQSNITLKRGIVDRGLWEWYWSLVQGDGTAKTVAIDVYEPATNDPVLQWECTGALPCKWIGPTLNAKENAVAIETLELCYHELLLQLPKP